LNSSIRWFGGAALNNHRGRIWHPVYNQYQQSTITNSDPAAHAVRALRFKDLAGLKDPSGLELIGLSADERVIVGKSGPMV